MVGIDGSTNADNHNNNNNTNTILTGDGYPAAFEGVGYPLFNWQGWIGMVKRRHDHDLPESRHDTAPRKGKLFPGMYFHPKGFRDMCGPKGKKRERKPIRAVRQILRFGFGRGEIPETSREYTE